MTVTPLHDYIVIEREVETQTKSGILLAGEKPTQVAKVIGIKMGISEDIFPGDRIVINKFAPLEMDVDGSKVTIVDLADVYAVINQEES